MRKRNHYELLAVANRAQMRSHALEWRAGQNDPHAGIISKEQRDESIATNLMCAKSYRDNSVSYAKMGAEERAEAERKPFPPTPAILPDGPDRVLVNGEPVICPRCNNEIDPHTCHCGDPIPGGCHDNHSPVPLGCTCHYPKKQIKEEPF